MTDKIEIQGKTVDEAVSEALLKMGARRDEVDVTVLEEPKSGFLGILGGRPARVVVRKRRQRRGGRRDYRKNDNGHTPHSLDGGEGGRSRGQRGGRRSAARPDRSGEGRDEARSGGNRGRSDGRRDNQGDRQQGRRDGRRDENRQEAGSREGTSRRRGRRGGRGRGRGRGGERQDGAQTNQGANRGTNQEQRGDNRQEARSDHRDGRQNEARRNDGRSDNRNERRDGRRDGNRQEAGQREGTSRRRGRRGGRGRGRGRGRDNENQRTPMSEQRTEAPAEKFDNTPVQDTQPVQDAPRRPEPAARAASPERHREQGNERPAAARVDETEMDEMQLDGRPMEGSSMAPDEEIVSGIPAKRYAKPLSSGSDFENQDEMLNKLAAGMLVRAGFPCRCEVVADEYSLVKIVTDDSSAGMLIGRHGQTVDAVEHLVERMAHTVAGERVFMNLDINNYRRRREETLVDRVADAISSVRSSGEEFHMEPMAARERRLVHLEAEEAGLHTRTDPGQGGKHVVIGSKPMESPDAEPARRDEPAKTAEPEAAVPVPVEESVSEPVSEPVVAPDTEAAPEATPEPVEEPVDEPAAEATAEDAEDSAEDAEEEPRQEF